MSSTLDHADARPALVAAEREVGDVDAVPAENRADLADDARLIVVRDEQQRPVERRLDRRRSAARAAAAVATTVPSTQRSPSLVSAYRQQAA